MATTQTDTLISVFTVPLNRTIGVSSKYADKEHPGTNKKVEGWKWDKRYWPTTREFEATSLAPSLWDPTVSGFSESLFQSGYGDNKDLLLLDVDLVETSGFHSWAPKVNHGYFYIYDEEWYLYSDLFQTQYFTKSMTPPGGGNQYLDLDYDYKPTIPIQVRRYEFDPALGRHIVNLDFRKKIMFSPLEDDLEPEFRIGRNETSGARLFLNGEYCETVGSPITLDISGFAELTDIQALEWLGISDGTADQEFHTSASPIDPFEEVEIWSYFLPTEPRQWTTLSGVEPFTSSGQQVHVDYDRGVFTFGDWDATTSGVAGLIPSAGERIMAHYTKGIAALYEPEFSYDYILARGADINPTTSFAYKGFVQVLTEPTDPASIVLEAELPTGSPTYLINLGNNTGRLIATVKNSVGQILEGEEVVFEILSPQVGTFGATSREISAVTDADGQAKVIYNAPATISDAGQVSDVISHDGGGNTEIEIEGLAYPGTVSGLSLYKIHYWDPPLGIPASGVDDYYTSYLDDEGIVSGTTSSQAWEEEFRAGHELGEPEVYDNDDLETGKKTIVLTTGKSNVVDPHTGAFSVTTWSPLYAESVEDIGTDETPKLRLSYSGELSLPGTDNTKAYLVVGDAGTYLRAYVVNKYTKVKRYSNQISLRVTIPDTADGTYIAGLLSSVPSGLLTKVQDIDIVAAGNIASTSGLEEWDGQTFWDSYIDERQFDDLAASTYEPYVDWFRRTRRADSRGLGLVISGLETVGLDPGILDERGELPLGFRLKSTGITVASILDQVTYFDPNTLLHEDYYELSGVY